MVSINAQVANLDEVTAALRRFGDRAEREIGRAVRAQAVDIRSDIQRRIQRGPVTGRVYLRGSVSHQASAPGEAPATDTGTLVSSIAFRQPAPLTAEVESRLDYAVMLEFGTVNMAARPSWVPSVEAKAPDFTRRVADAIIRAQGGGL